MGFGAQLDAIIREIPDLIPRSKVVDSPGVPKIGTQQFSQAIGVNATRNLSRSLLHENDSPPPEEEEVVRGWWHGAQSPLALLITEGNCVVFMEGGEPRSMRSSIQMLHRRWPVYSHEPYHFELLTCANTHSLDYKIPAFLADILPPSRVVFQLAASPSTPASL